MQVRVRGLGSQARGAVVRGFLVLVAQVLATTPSLEEARPTRTVYLIRSTGTDAYQRESAEQSNMNCRPRMRSLGAATLSPFTSTS